MNRVKRTPHNIPFSWFILLPLLGIPQKIGVLFGWLNEGSWLNFILLLIAPILWVVLVLQRTESSSFNPLLLIGLIYGFYLAVTEFIYWLIFQDSHALAQGTWTFNDLMGAITYFLIPIFRFFGHLLFGLLIGAITGFIAQLIAKRRRQRT